MNKWILYHENNKEKSYIPQEDMYANSDLTFAVADGVTLDPDERGVYPIPSDSAVVAKIICDELVKFLEKKDPSLELILDAYLSANKKVLEFNQTSQRYANRENNGYSIGAATCALVCISENKLLYGVLDDCYISIFSDDYVDHPILKDYVADSAKFLNANYDWSKPESRKFWRKELRNHTFVKDGVSYGYGVIDGRPGFDKYLQLGEVDLKPNDLICVYSDGFIPLIREKDLIMNLREKPFTGETFDLIKDFSNKLNITKEKTAYFIKY